MITQIGQFYFGVPDEVPVLRDGYEWVIRPLKWLMVRHSASGQLFYVTADLQFGYVRLPNGWMHDELKLNLQQEPKNEHEG